MRRLLPIALIVLLAAPAFALHSVPKSHHRVKVRKLHSKWNPLFWPSRLSLILQNREIDQDGLERYQDYDDVAAAVRRGELVSIPVSNALTVDKRLDPRRRYCRPWTAQFLTDISNDFYAQFHRPLMVDSAVRPLEVQKRLRRRNHNAAPTEGETASSHMAGLTVDLARGYMTPTEARWLENHLLIMHSYGWVEVEEEHVQLCFHIMVAKRYGGDRITIVTSTVENEEGIDNDNGDSDHNSRDNSSSSEGQQGPSALRTGDPRPAGCREAGDHTLEGPEFPSPE